MSAAGLLSSQWSARNHRSVESTVPSQLKSAGVPGMSFWPVMTRLKYCGVCVRTALWVTVTVNVPGVLGDAIRTCSTLSRKLSPVEAAAAGFAGSRMKGRYVAVSFGAMMRRSRSLMSWGVGSSRPSEPGPGGSVQHSVALIGLKPSHSKR